MDGFCKSQKSEITLEVDVWVQVMFWGRPSRPYIPCVIVLCTLLIVIKCIMI